VIRPRIVFVTTVFENVKTGPGIFARYLWEHFCNDDDMDFHLVAPDIKEKEPRLHSFERPKDSIKVYTALQDKALELVRRLGHGTVVHGNMAHIMWRFTRYNGPLLVQVNDYSNSDYWKYAIESFLRTGIRRQISLIWRRWYERQVTRQASMVLCNSEYTRNSVLKAYGVCPDRCRVLYKAVDLTPFVRPDVLPPARVPRPPGEKHRLIFVGTDWERKGLDVLFRALRLVLDRQQDVILLVAGPDEFHGNARIRALVKELKLTNHVRFLGATSRADLPNLLWNSDVAVLPSRREAFGVSILEAMAAGVPVVATRTGGIPEIVNNSSLGVLCEPGNPVDLARGVRELYGALAQT
jgi:glycosyltransferase involved in cell wall biosynthesis